MQAETQSVKVGGVEQPVKKLRASQFNRAMQASRVTGAEDLGGNLIMQELVLRLALRDARTAEGKPLAATDPDYRALGPILPVDKYDDLVAETGAEACRELAMWCTEGCMGAGPETKAGN